MADRGEVHLSDVVLAPHEDLLCSAVEMPSRGYPGISEVPLLRLLLWASVLSRLQPVRGRLWSTSSEVWCCLTSCEATFIIGQLGSGREPPR